MKDFLLEIGCEDIPPSYIAPAVEQLRAGAEKLLKDLRLIHEGIYASGTPRRLVLVVHRLAPVQGDRVETVTGPPISKCFDESGRPTQAAAGFARSYGMSLSKLKTIRSKRGEFLGFTRKTRGGKTPSVLKQHLPALICSLKFPKTMRWEGEGVRFARPIRWIVCLYGDSVVRFRVASISSGNVTYRIPWLDKERIRIASASGYFELMAQNGVVLDQEEREEKIRHLARDAAIKAGLELLDDPGLIRELTFMLESPGVVMGEFPEGYLALPHEVVITAMKAHQRYFALKDRGGKVVPRFLAFYERRIKDLGVVREGNEKVLRARLEDALFYWREDLKRGIRRIAEKLDRVVFIEGLGSLKDKAERLRLLMLYLDDMQGEDRRQRPEKLGRLAQLAKADLASEMIKDGKEFTLLEGLIGSRYAKEAGEPKDIVQAIEEQYAPRSSGDALPDSLLGTYLSIADRIDTICGCFIAGLVPTGSQDPYGLRRQALGLIRILERGGETSVDSLVSRALDCYEGAGFLDATGREKLFGEIGAFFKGRIEWYLKEKGLAYDVVGAVSEVSWMHPSTCLKRCLIMEKMRGKTSFELLITGAKRVGNILSEKDKLYGLGWISIKEAFFELKPLAGKITFSPDLFEDEAESSLFCEVKERIPVMIRYDDSSRFDRVLEELSALGQGIDRYFDRVLVNCERDDLRRNRHNFLACVFALFSRYGNFSYIVESKSPAPS